MLQNYNILSCVKKKNPANCSYFICKASNDKYFKWLSIYCFSLVAHQPFDRFSYLWEKLDHFLLLSMEVYFYSYFIVCFFSPLSGLIKLMMTTLILFLYFLHFRCCSFFFPLASSICLCHNASFISNLHNKKKSLKVIMSDAC